MNNMEELSNIAMHIISYAGMAKSNYLQGLERARDADYEAVERCIALGDENFKVAHQHHNELLAKEASEEQAQVSLLLVHAETQLMLAETVKLLMREFLWILKNKS